MRRIFFSLVILLTLGSSVAQARVFNFSGERFAPYLKGTYVPTSTGDSAFATSSGTGNTFSKKNTYNSSFEFGFAYGIDGIRVRFGFEVLRPPALMEVAASDAGGTELFTLNSDIVGYAPKLGFEIDLAEWPTSRFYISGDVSTMSVTVKNTYTLNAAGQAAYPAVVDFMEELKGSGQGMDAAFGFETLMFDTTTLSLELGYRVLVLKSFSHNLPVTSFQGAVVKGDAALNDDGTSREIKMTNYYAGLGFRFWIF